MQKCTPFSRHARKIRAVARAVARDAARCEDLAPGPAMLQPAHGGAKCANHTCPERISWSTQFNVLLSDVEAPKISKLDRPQPSKPCFSHGPSEPATSGEYLDRKAGSLRLAASLRNATSRRRTRMNVRVEASKSGGRPTRWRRWQRNPSTSLSVVCMLGARDLTARRAGPGKIKVRLPGPDMSRLFLPPRRCGLADSRGRYLLARHDCAA